MTQDVKALNYCGEHLNGVLFIETLLLSLNFAFMFEYFVDTLWYICNLQGLRHAMGVILRCTGSTSSSSLFF